MAAENLGNAKKGEDYMAMNVLPQEKLKLFPDSDVECDRTSGKDKDPKMEEIDEKPMKMSAKRKWIAAVIIISVGIQGLNYSFIASYFPQEALKKNFTHTDVGLVFCAFSASALMLTYFGPTLIATFGPRKVFLFSTFLSSLSLVSFGFVMYAGAGVQFYVSCLGSRFVQGLAWSGIHVSTLFVFASQYKENLALLSGLVEMAFAAGATAGPFVGGILFDEVGFEAPSVVMASTTFIFGILGYFFVHPERPINDKPSKARDKLPYKKILMIPEFTFPVLAYVFALMSVTYINVSLGPHLSLKFGFSSTSTGIYFVIHAFVAMIAAPIVGVICDKKGHHQAVIIIGFLLLALSQFLYGPAPFLPFEGTLVTIVISLSIMGFSFPMAVVPVLAAVLEAVRLNGIEETEQLIYFANSACVAVINLGSVLGPFLGGILVNYLKFEWSAAAFAFSSLTVGLTGAALMIRRNYCAKRIRLSSEI